MQEFELWTFHDNQGSPEQTGHRSWFYFSVQGHMKSDFIVMTIMNMNKQAALYTDDYRVWWRAHPSCTSFRRTAARVQYKKGEQSTLRFSHKFESAELTLFAFCVPWSCADNSLWLRRIEQHLSPSAALQGILEQTRTRQSASGANHTAQPSSAECNPSASAPNERIHVPTSARSGTAEHQDRQIYFHRQTLARTLQGRKIDIVTITDSCGWNDGEDEAALPGAPPPLEVSCDFITKGAQHTQLVPCSCTVRSLVSLQFIARSPHCRRLC